MKHLAAFPGRRVRAVALCTTALVFGCALVVLTPGVASAAYVSPIPDATAGMPYSQQIPYNPSDKWGPFVFTVVEGVVPPGLTVSADGLVSGTPVSQVDAPLKSLFILKAARASNPNGPADDVYVDVIVRTPGYVSRPKLTVTRNGAQGATVHKPYSVTFEVSGGTPPYRMGIGGALPKGLTWSAQGARLTIEGTPTEVEKRDVTFGVLDGGERCFATATPCYQRIEEGQSYTSGFSIGVSSGVPLLDPTLWNAHDFADVAVANVSHTLTVNVLDPLNYLLQ